MINWIQVKLCFLKYSWLWYFQFCSLCVICVRYKKSVRHKRWGEQASSCLIECFLHLFLLHFTVPETSFASGHVQQMRGWTWVLLLSAASSPLRYFSSFLLLFQFLFNCFGFMRGQSVSSVVGILGSRWRLPGSLYSTLIGYTGPYTSANKIMSLRKHPIDKDSDLCSFPLSLSSLCIFISSSRDNPRKTNLSQVLLADFVGGLAPQSHVQLFPVKLQYSTCSPGNIMGMLGWKFQHQNTC